MIRWLIFTIASACVVLSHVIPEGAHTSNTPDPFAVGCNVTKSCFLVPDSCLSTGSCRAGVAVVSTSGRFQFEMMAVDSVYVAVGLSDDAFMGKDSVVECIHDELAPDKGVQIFVSFNVGTTNTRIKTSAAENGVNLVSGTFLDGVVRCTFTRDNATRAEGVVFDLVKRQYHLLVASGTKITATGIAFHDRESAGSRNGRSLGVVGMFVDPNSYDAVKELAEADNLLLGNPTSADEEESDEGDAVEGSGEDATTATSTEADSEESDEDDDVEGIRDYYVATAMPDDAEDKEGEEYDVYGDVDEETNSTSPSEFLCGNYDEYDDYEWITDREGLVTSDADEDDVTAEYDDGDGGGQESLWNTNEETTKGFTARGCNETKSCFLMPASCLLTDACTLAASVRQTDAGFEFEMLARDSVYVAVALSSDAVMGSDSVVECVSDGVDLLGYTSWNKGHKNHRIHEPLSKSGVALLEGSTADGKVYCKFSRDPITTADGVVFDLNKSKFHLLMASGTKLKEDGVGFHDRGYAGSYDGRLLADVGMFAQRRSRHMIDDPEGSYELADAFRPIVTIV